MPQNDRGDAGTPEPRMADEAVKPARAGQKLYSAAQMREADEAAAASGVSSQLLMEAAGRAVADAARRHFPDSPRTLILCGKGNNGGDGYVAARYLLMAGRAVEVLELGEPGRADAKAARDALLAFTQGGRGAPKVLDLTTLHEALAQADLVIDALFGSGLGRPLADAAAQAVEAVNERGLPVLAVDLPSGIAADSPKPIGPHLRAQLTVQLAGAKLASAFYPAREAFGRQETVPIGIPPAILDREYVARLLDPASARAALPRRAKDAHKYRAGTVLVVAGSAHYLGAAELACRGAHRSGAGLVSLAAQGRHPSGWPETILEPLDWSDAVAAAERLERIEAKRAQAIVAGPGLDERALGQLPRLLAARKAAPWVLDAGALAAGEELRQAVANHGGCVLTPHAGEAARLLGTEAREVTSDPLRSAGAIARQWQAICVLKGATTVVASPSGNFSVYPGGNPGMASGGTGDVLAGILGALLAAGSQLDHDPLHSTEAAVVLHGVAGQLAFQAAGTGLVASDVAGRVPAALAMMREQRA